ncbi:hypothetical protein GWI33_020448 [Rhynchophorus ferrugineus]|uniref:Uncharacterized protein n=1 Tax=Rhynchophorus ferrugineus TaxID=354439 RepID=A0A834HSA6_RHYFE|nr:hypothetical protein GWI33_020448 [Rhynchophorus ferrugineus]
MEARDPTHEKQKRNTPAREREKIDRRRPTFCRQAVDPTGTGGPNPPRICHEQKLKGSRNRAFSRFNCRLSGTRNCSFLRPVPPWGRRGGGWGSVEGLFVGGGTRYDDNEGDGECFRNTVNVLLLWFDIG